MQSAGGGDGLAGHAGGDVAAGEGGDNARKHVPESGGNGEGGNRRIVAGAGIEGRDTDTNAQHRQENLDDEGYDNTGEDRSP